MLCALQPLPCKSTSSRIFPCALPFRCVARDVTLSCKVRWARRFVNDMFAWFSWLEVGCPADPQRADMMRWIPSEVCGLARQYADRLVVNLLRQRLSHRSICIADLTTGRGRLDTLVESSGPSCYHPSAVPLTVSGRQDDIACDVVASRAALPVVAGLTGPLLHLPPTRAGVCLTSTSW